MATELGQAYVQVMPSAKGISGMIKKQIQPEAESSGQSAGLSLGKKMISAVSGVIAAAGIGKLFASSISEGAALQQSIGGIETLFKDSADTVKNYANQAYKTAGVSANKYMENVTSFSASLISSLGGDTASAAELANTAMVDMSDNANKMGTDMESITQTYQSLARGNFAMLDNLKLGYGGTKSEMERLMADAEKLTGEHYTVGDFADTVKAIHAVQESLGITGTTAKEAATTLSGSLASMKAAFSDFLGKMAIGDDIKPSLNALAETASTFFFGNLLPMIGNIVKAIPGAVVTFIKAAIPQVQKGMQDLMHGIASQFPIMQKVFDFVGNHAEVFKLLAVSVAGAVGAFVTLKGAIAIFNQVKTAISATVKAFNLLKAAFIANPFTVAIVAIGALVAAFVYLYKTNDTVREKVNGMLKIFSRFNQPITKTIAGLKLLAQGFKEMITNGPGPKIAELRKQFENFLPESLWNKMLQFAQSLNSLRSAFHAIVKVASGAIQSMDGLDTFLGGAVSSNTVKNIYAVGKAIKSVIKWFKGFIHPVNSANQSIDLMGTSFELAFKVLKSVFLGLLGPIGLFIKAFELIAKVLGGGEVSKGIDKILTAFDSLASGLKENGSKVGNSAGKAIEGILSTISGALPGIISGGLQIVAAIVSGIAQGLPSLILSASQLIMAFTAGMLVLVPQIALSATAIIVALLAALTAGVPQIIMAGGSLILALLSGITQQLPALIESAITLILTFLTALTEHVPEVVIAGMSLLIAVLDGIVQKLPDLIETVSTLIVTFLTALSEKLPDIVVAGATLLINFLNGLASKMPDIISAATTVIVNFINGIANNLGQIINAAVNLIIKFLGGIAKKIPDIVNAAMNLVDAMVRGIIQAQGRLMDAAIRLINGFANNIRNRQGEVRSAALNLLGAIIGVFVPDSLVRAGASIIDGFLSGLKSGFEKVKNFVGGIADWIKEHKGPISYDRKLLIPAGHAIMDGLNTGLMQRFTDVQSTVKDMSSNILNDFLDTESLGNPKIRLQEMGSSLRTNDLSGAAYPPIYINLDGTVVLDKNKVGVLLAPTVKVENDRIERIKNKVYGNGR